MNIKQFILLLFFFSICSLNYGQIEINKPIIFTSSDDINNTIENITTTSNVDLISAKEVIYNQFQYAEVTIDVDTIFASFTHPYESLNIGFKVYLKIPSNSLNGIKFLKIDNLEKKPIFLNNSVVIGFGDFEDNQTFSSIYDGTAFQMMSNLGNLKDCPSGFVEINQQYCVSQFREGPGTFKDNYKNCTVKGARLCSWSEWYYACKNNSGLISDMDITGSEWLESGGNNANSAKVIGSGACEGHGFADISNNTFYFRCCYSRK